VILGFVLSSLLEEDKRVLGTGCGCGEKYMDA